MQSSVEADLLPVNRIIDKKNSESMIVQMVLSKVSRRAGVTTGFIWNVFFVIGLTGYGLLHIWYRVAGQAQRKGSYSVVAVQSILLQ